MFCLLHAGLQGEARPLLVHVARVFDAQVPDHPLRAQLQQLFDHLTAQVEGATGTVENEQP